MNTKKKFFIISSTILLSILSISLVAQESSSSKGRLAIFSGVGISNCYGDYPSEYDAKVEFSFHPGARLQLNEIFNSKMLLFIDFGYLEIAYKGFVGPTDTYFYNNYEFLAFTTMAGIPLGESGYLSGGLFFGKPLDANSYREYIDDWISLDHESDFGLVAEIGKDLGEYFTIGVQGRFGLKSIGEKVDTKTWALHGRLCINLFRF
jgi:hypothetical protein